MDEFHIDFTPSALRFLRGLSRNLPFSPSDWQGIMPTEESTIPAERIRELVLRISASTGFRRSPQLIRLLEYISDRALEGDRDALSEQQIGERVFKRAPSYNTGDDSIVRAHARLLRKKLDLFFEDEGRDERLRILIPRGTYVPQWVAGKSTALLTVLDDHPPIPSEPVAELFPGISSASPADAQAPASLPESSPPRRHWYTVLWTVAACVLVVGSVLLFLRRDNTNAVWRVLFTRERPTVFVPVDSGLILYQNLTQRNVDIPEYSSGSYLSKTGSPFNVPGSLVESFGSRRYTSMADVRLGLLLMHIADQKRHDLVVSYARDIRIQDLKNANLIINGDIRGNPWVKLFDPFLNFTMKYDEETGVYTIVNAKPHPGEQAIYRYDPADPDHTAYSIISMLPNLSGTGNVLLIESTTMAGSDAAADFLSNNEDLNNFLKGSGARDRPGMRFDLLLKTKNIGLSSPHYDVEAYRIGK